MKIFNGVNKHIILIGFKHVGKSVIGRTLAEKVRRPFLDLDEQIELEFLKESGQKFNCRQIMKNNGERFFRDLESRVLARILMNSPAVISLGGGTPLAKDNQQLIKQHRLVLVNAPKGIVFERIMINGRPAFFSPEETPLESFQKLWEERKKVYEELSEVTVENSGSVTQAAEDIISQLKL